MKTTLLLSQRLLYHLQDNGYFAEHGGIRWIGEQPADSDHRIIEFEDGCFKKFDMVDCEELTR